MKSKLTAVTLPVLKSGLYGDGVLPGLYLRVGANRRSWILRTRLGGVQRMLTIGRFPSLGLGQARDEARAIMERLEKGERPAAGLTLAALIDAYEAHRRAKGGRIKRLDHALRTVRSG